MEIKIPEFVLQEMDLMSADLSDEFFKCVIDTTVSPDEMGDRLHHLVMKYLKKSYQHGIRECKKIAQ